MLENWGHFHWVRDDLGAGLKLGRAGGGVGSGGGGGGGRGEGATVSEDYWKRDVG